MNAPSYTEHTTKDLKNFTRVMAVFFALLTLFFLLARGLRTHTYLKDSRGVSAGWLLWGLGHPQSTKPLTTVGCARVLHELCDDEGHPKHSLFGIVLPTSLLTRIMGKDFLGNKSKDSYWHSREQEQDNKHFENLFS